MNGSFWRYWGKADGTGAYHLAVLHCLDVAAVGQRLIERNAVLGRRLAALLSLPKEAVAPTLLPVLALHDIGKLDARFQIKVPEIALALDASRAGLPVDSYDHGAHGYHHLRVHTNDVRFALGEDALFLLQAACGHHGSLPSNRVPAARPLPAGIRAADEEARKEWLDALLQLSHRNGALLPWSGRARSAAVELVAGLVAVADWIGSQADFFPYRDSPSALEAYYADSLSRADRALNAIEFGPAPPRNSAFEQLFPAYKPRGIQRTVAELPVSDEPCLVLIESPMGSGKTEAALSLVGRFLASGSASGLFFALPTMATSNAMFGRLTEVVPRMFETTVAMRLAHGRSRLNPVFERFINGPLNDPRDPDLPNARIACARWFLSRKRALLAQVGVGTVDQAMQAALFVRHHFVRAYGLATSAVIIDEVHAYDAYMSVIIDRLLEWLAALGAPVVLLSATLPAERRAEMVQAYGRGLGLNTEVPASADAAYPLVTVIDRRSVDERTCAISPPERQVACQLIETDQPMPIVLPVLAPLVASGAMVCWIRNTVREAQEAFGIARASDIPAMLFHSRFRGADRSRIEEEVLRRFGGGGDRSCGLLLIATQVAEQSLDLDFDFLVTDLAPIDLVLQRVGRLHRHDQQQRRPVGCLEARLWVIAPSSSSIDSLEFDGSGYVYDRVTLWLAADSLRSRSVLRLPSDIRDLVEASYDSRRRQARIEAARNREQLEKAEEKRRARLEEMRARARGVSIPPVELDAAATPCVRDDDALVAALTREGDSSQFLLVAWDEATGTGRSIAGGDPWELGSETGAVSALGRRLLEELIPGPWNASVAAQGRWRAWSKQCEDLLESAGLGRTVVVPVRPGADRFYGDLMINKRPRRIEYDPAIGLSLGEA